MKIPRPISAIILATLMFNYLLPCPAAELKPGDEAPDFSLPGTDGKTHRLADYRGKQVVVLAWFPKAKTSGCTAECKSMREHGDAIRKFDVAYFTASCDTPELNKEFAEELQLDYPILSDPDHKVSDAYGVTNAERKFPMRWTFYIGTDGKILAIDKQVKTASHGSDIAERLKELGAREKT
jgi:peroxiredoxin Q/BCP